jgi:Uma2 family endonuclease
MMMHWLFVYSDDYPELESCGPCSVFLDGDNEPIPDSMLFRRFTILRDDGWLEGAPDLIVEVADRESYERESVQKKEAYRRNGVREYIVWRVQDEAIDWFELVDGQYVTRTPDDAGIVESAQFPGLRLDVPATLALDRQAVLAALARDTARPG